MKGVNFDSEIRDLEPIPQVAFQIMEMAQDPDVAIQDVANLIAHDTAITANILRVVNSAFYGLRRKVSSVHDAVILVGLDTVIQLAFMQAASVNLKRKYVGYDLEEGELWKHSAASAILARQIAGKIGTDKINLVFTSALLKDIGKVVLNQYVAQAIQDINNLVHEAGYGFLEAEKDVLGMDHAELGGLIAEKWNFSVEMIRIIRNHHLTDGEGLDHDETCIVHLADAVCSMMGIGTGSDGMAYRFADKVLKKFDYTEKGLDTIIMEYGSKRSEIDALIDSFLLA
jgi:putative nucleotidyltransferase with HDIG domain